MRISSGINWKVPMEALAIGPSSKYLLPSGLIPNGWTGIESVSSSARSLKAQGAPLARGAGVSRCMPGSGDGRTGDAEMVRPGRSTFWANSKLYLCALYRAVSGSRHGRSQSIVPGTLQICTLLPVAKAKAERYRTVPVLPRFIRPAFRFARVDLAGLQDHIPPFALVVGGGAVLEPLPHVFPHIARSTFAGTFPYRPKSDIR